MFVPPCHLTKFGHGVFLQPTYLRLFEKKNNGDELPENHMETYQYVNTNSLYRIH